MPPPLRGAGLHRLLAVAFVVGVTLTCLLIGTGLLTSSPHGAGDNGDGVRLYCGAGLVPDTPTTTSRWQGVVVDDFRTDGLPCADPVPSSALLPLEITAGLSGASWNLSGLGWFYVAATCVGVGVAAAAAAVRRAAHALVVLPVVLPLALPAFSRFLLSTYSEPAGLVGAAISFAGIAAVATTAPRGGARCTALGVALVGGIVASTAKPAYLAVLIPALVVCVLFPPARSRMLGVLVVLAAVAVVALPVSVALTAQDRDYGAINTHNLVFTAVAPASRGDALDRLGLPPEAARALGRAYYPEGGTDIPDWDRVVGDRWRELRSAARIYVLTHPRTALRMVDASLRAASDPRLHYLPSELASSPSARPIPVPVRPVGEQGAEAGPLDAWLASRPFGWAPAVLVLVCAAVAVTAARRRPGPVTAGLAVLAATSGGAVLATAMTAVAGDGFFEIAKHTWLSSFLVAVAAASLLALAVHLVVGRAGAGRTPPRPPA